MPEDRSSTIPSLYHICLGCRNGEEILAPDETADVSQIGMGFPKRWTVMIPLRMLLGLLEAGFFPGCVYLLSIVPT